MLYDRSIIGQPMGWEMEVVNRSEFTATVSLILVCAEAEGVKIGVTGGSATRSGNVVLDVATTQTLTVPTSGSAFFFECLKGVNVGIAYSPSTGPSTLPPRLGTWYHRPVAPGSETLNPKQRTIAFVGGAGEASVQLRPLCLKTNAGFSVPKPGTIDLKLRY